MEPSSMESATSAVPKWDKARLTGQLVRVWPYARGMYARDMLYHCWALMENEGMAKKIFHSSFHPPECDVDWRGDLTEFVTYFSQPTRLLQICQHAQTQELAGMIWFEEIVAQCRASCGIIFAKKFWGPLTKEASRICMDYAFYALDIPALYSFTPWPEAKRHAQQIGFEYLTSIPEMVLWEEQRLPMHVLRAKREGAHG